MIREWLWSTWQARTRTLARLPSWTQTVNHTIGKTVSPRSVIAYSGYELAIAVPYRSQAR
jgi:hypothetical protein